MSYHLIAALVLAVAAASAAAQATAPRPFNATSYDTEGWAQGTRGGRGGRILKVINLNAEGPGSLRAALEAEGPRTVVFEVGGVIDMGGRNVVIRQPFLTLAGQTAPRPGITIVKGETEIGTHDVIIQHLMIRPGEFGRPKKKGGDQDGISTIAGAYNVIVDHCSFSWATDENLSISGPRFQGADPDEWRHYTSHDITYSHNLIYEGLSNSVHEKGEHSKGSLIHDNTTGVLLLANVYASNRQRSALFKGGTWGAMVNNLIFNPGNRAVHYNLLATEWQGHPFLPGRLSLVGNVLRQGPDTPRDTALFMLGGQGDIELFMQDNLALDASGAAVAQIGSYSTGGARIVPVNQPYLPAKLLVQPAQRIEQDLPRAVGARPWDRDA
ncbi:MAG: pectate lyase, partial [Burkholderiales bacterium]|nr:pectate lyase [Burkholderiales bacterium]